jgi:glycosyltransferase involved in cell wall biosynthesis
MKLSIITINKDNAEGLRRTMESVLVQTNKDFEYVVVDGASTDGSVEVMQELSVPIKESGIAVDARSEPDLGLYNAMNKGVRKAQGDYVLMLNSGDWFVDEHVVEKVLPLLDGTDIIQGNVIRLRDGKEILDRGYGRSDINFIDVQQGHFLHQASFCRSDLFEKCGYFDESFKIAGDTAFYIQALGYKDASFKYLDLMIAYFQCGGRSDAANEAWNGIKREEFARLSKDLFSNCLWQTCIEYDKKGRLYDKLHRHKWAWNMTMLLVKIIDRIEK